MKSPYRFSCNKIMTGSLNGLSLTCNRFEGETHAPHPERVIAMFAMSVQSYTTVIIIPALRRPNNNVIARWFRMMRELVIRHCKNAKNKVAGHAAHADNGRLAGYDRMPSKPMILRKNTALGNFVYMWRHLYPSPEDYEC